MSTLKAMLPIGLLIAVVFGATFISQFSPSRTDVGGIGGPPGPDAPTGMPVRLTVDKLRYDPTSDDPAVRFYPGFYEVGPTPHPSCFWLTNVRPDPVEVAVVHRSCSSCSAARVAAVPADKMVAAVSGKAAGLPPVLPVFGPLPVGDPVTAVAAAAGLADLTWHEFDFGKKFDPAAIPGGSEAAPTWACVQVGVTVGGVGPKTLTATLGFKTAAMREPAVVPLTVAMTGVTPFAVTPGEVTVGAVAATGGPVTRDVVCWSATRGPDALPPPLAAVDSADGLVAVGAAEPLGDGDRWALARAFGEDGKPMPVRAAYRLPLTVRPRPADGAGAAPDIGPFERSVGVSGGGYTQRVAVRGELTGVVEVAAGSLDLGRFVSRYGKAVTVELVSDVPGLDLAPVPEEFRPAYLKAALEPRGDAGGRRRWGLTVTAPPDAVAGPLTDAVVVLRASGPTDRRIRLPVKGTGGLGS